MICFVCFLFVLCFCIVLYTVSPHEYICLFSICLQFYRALPPAENPIAISKYHIIQ